MGKLFTKLYDSQKKGNTMRKLKALKSVNDAVDMYIAKDKITSDDVYNLILDFQNAYADLKVSEKIEENLSRMEMILDYEEE